MRCAPLGGSSGRFAISVDDAPATSGAKIATTQTQSKKTSETRASRCARKRRQASRVGVRRLAAGPSAKTCEPPAGWFATDRVTLLKADPRIDPAVAEVDEEVGDEDGGG